MALAEVEAHGANVGPASEMSGRVAVWQHKSAGVREIGAVCNISSDCLLVAPLPRAGRSSTEKASVARKNQR